MKRQNTVFFLTPSLIFENILVMLEYLKILTFPSKQVKTSASRICYEIMSTFCFYYLSVQHFSSANFPRFLPSWPPPLFLLWNWSPRRQVTFLLLFDKVWPGIWCKKVLENGSSYIVQNKKFLLHGCMLRPLTLLLQWESGEYNRK